MSAAQKKAQANFKKAIAYRKKTGCSLKEAFAHVKGSKVTGLDKVVKKGNKTTVLYTKKAKKKAAPKKKVSQGVLFGVKKKSAPKKKAISKHKDTKSHNVNIRVMSGDVKIDIHYLNEIKDVFKKIEAAEKHLKRNNEYLKNNRNLLNTSHNGIVLKRSLLKDNVNLKKYIIDLKKHKTQLKKLL